MNRRWLMRGARVGLIAVAVIVAVALYVVATGPGARLAFSLARNALGDSIAIGPVEGSFVGGLHIAEIAVPASGDLLAATDIGLKVQLGALLRGELHLAAIEIGEVIIDVSAGDEPSDPTPADTALPTAPLPISVDSIAIERLVVRADETEQVLSVRAGFAWRGALLALPVFDVGTEGARANGRMSVELATTGDVDVELAWQTAAPFPSSQGALTVGGTVAALTIEHRLYAPVAAVTRGTVEPAPLQADITTEWLQQSLAGVGLDDASVADGSLQTRIVDSRVLWSLRGAGTWQDQPPIALTADGALDAERVLLDDFAVSHPTGRLLLSGELTRSGDGFAGDLRIDSVLEQWPTDTVRLPQSIVLNGRASGRWDPASGPSATLVLDEPDGRAAVTGTLRWSSDVARLDDLALVIGADRVAFSGSAAAAALDLDGRWRVQDIGRWLPDVAGSASGSVQVQGSLEQPRAVLTAGLAGLSVDGLTLSEAQINATVDPSGSAAAVVELTAVNIADRPFGDWTINASGNASQHRIEADGTSSAVQTRVVVEGSARDEAYRLRVAEFVFDGGMTGPWELATPNAEVVATAERLSMPELCVTGGGSVCVAGDVDLGSGQADAKLAIAALPVDAIARWALPEIDLYGVFSADVQGRWANDRIDGDFSARLDDAEMRRPQTDDNATGNAVRFAFELSGDVAANRVAAQANFDVPEAGQWTASATVDDVFAANSAIELNSQAQFPNLALLDEWIPGLRVTAGKAQLAFDLAGSRAAPTANARLNLDDFDARVTATGTAIRDVDVSLASAEPATWRLDAKAGVGDGQLRAVGTLNWPTAAGWSGEISLAGDTVRIADLPELRLDVAPDLKLTKRDNTMTIGGELAVPSARLSPIETPPGAIEPSSDVVLHGGPDAPASAASARTELDLGIEFGDDVRLDGYGLTARLDGRLRLAGQLPDAVRAFGNLSLLDGQFEAYGQELALDQGELVFGGDPLNPGLNVVATREVEPGTVGVRIRGELQNPVSTLTSTPTLPQTEILAWLITGRGLNAVDSTQNETLSGAAVALGLTQLGGITGRLQASLGLDALSFDGNADDGQLLAGKWIGERLYLQYAVGIFDKIGSVLIRYRLSDRLRFESRTGTEQSLDLVYSVERDAR
ncbi:MAG: translocation/assembly module TamB domain-containing protein [Pseudomonadota bacterium]